MCSQEVEGNRATQVKLLKPPLVTYHTYHEGSRFMLKISHWYRMSVQGEQNPVPQQEEDIHEICWVAAADLDRYKADTFPVGQRRFKGRCRNESRRDDGHRQAVYTNQFTDFIYNPDIPDMRIGPEVEGTGCSGYITHPGTADVIGIYFEADTDKPGMIHYQGRSKTTDRLASTQKRPMQGDHGAVGSVGQRASGPG